jgi:hypothetical protein
MTHHAFYWYNINKTMRHDLDFFCDKLKPDLGINWGTPIAHLIPRTSFATRIGNSSLTGAGGFSIALGLWWHITFPDKVIQCTLCFKSDNVDGTLILINFLEFVTVIINYCAALHVVRTTTITSNPHPILLNIMIIFLRRIGPSKRAKVPRLVTCLPVSSVTVDKCATWYGARMCGPKSNAY